MTIEDLPDDYSLGAYYVRVFRGAVTSDTRSFSAHQLHDGGPYKPFTLKRALLKMRDLDKDVLVCPMLELADGQDMSISVPSIGYGSERKS